LNLIQFLSARGNQWVKKQLIYGNREHWAWYLYDFGNSAYAAVVVLQSIPHISKDQSVGGAKGTALWGTSVGIGHADQRGALHNHRPDRRFSATKKKLLFGFSAMSWIFTALLFFVTKGAIFLGMLFYILAEIGYRLGQVFYNGLLPEITTSKDLGRVSGNGWAIGSLGGIVCLLIVLPIILLGGDGNFPVRISMVITAVFFALSTIPGLLWIKERAHPKTARRSNYLTIGFKRLGQTIKNIRTFERIAKFMCLPDLQRRHHDGDGFCSHHRWFLYA